MKKVVTIHIANEVFQIEEDGFQMLQQVFGKLRNKGINEVAHAETEIARYFNNIMQKGGKVITSDHVIEALKTNGYYMYLGSQNSSGEYQRLYRRSDDRILGGVCSGLAQYWNIDPVLIRLLFVVLFLGFGTGLLLYIIMWIVVPKA